MMRHLLGLAPFRRSSLGLRLLVVAGLLVIQGVAGSLATAQNPLVAHYNFDDAANTYTTSGTIFDVSGNAFNGTVVNAALTHNATGGVSGGSINAVSSGTASFTTSYAANPVAADDFTLMFWVKAGAPTSFLDFGQINYSNGTSGQLRTTSTNREFYYRHVVTSNQAFQFGAAGGAAIVDNSGSGSVWKQVAFMASASTGQYGYYVDGGSPIFQDLPTTNNPFTAETTVTGLRIGRSNWANSRTGQIDEVQLYDRSLTQAEVQLLFANPGYGGTNFRVWDSTSASNSWTGAADWQGLGTAAAPGVTGNAASTNADVAILKNYAFSGGLGIDMSAAGADGSLALGGISFSSASGPLRIGNSAADTTGTLRLNGGLVDSVANTILKVAGTSDLTIGDSASGSGTQTMAVELTAAANIIDVAASRALSIESAISQSGAGSAIQKTGAGTLALSGANTFTGGTTISGGTLEVASIADSGTSNLGSAGSLALGGGTLRYTGSGAQATTRDLSIDGGASTIDVVSPTGSLTFSSSGGTRTASLTKAGSGSLAIDGGFSGSAGITVAAGTLALGAASTHSGPTSVAAGATLELADGAALQNSALSPAAGATVSLTATPGGTYTIGSIAGGAALDAMGSTLAVGSDNATTSYSGVLTASAFQKQGTGTLTLLAANTFDSVEVQGGMLAAANAAAVGNAPVILAGGTFRYGGNTTLLSALTLSGAAATNTIDLGIDSLEVLVVGGGGGGGGGVSNVSYPAGGGGGQVVAASGLQPTSASVAVTVGGGGGYGSGAAGTSGGSSSILSVTASGGIGGGVAGPGVGGASGSGNAGGANLGTTAAGGGGGQTAVGQQGISSPRRGGHGGAGLTSSITGTDLMYGFGGGGGAPTSSDVTRLSLNGDDTSTNPRANSGGGGRATSGPSTTTGIGAAGVVVVRYLGDQAATGGQVDTSSVPGYTVHTFTADETLAFSASRTISGTIGGSGGFTFNSAGTLELTGNNSYQGGTVISRGTLIAGSPTALGSGPTTVRSAGSLEIADTAALQSKALVTEAGATVALTAAGTGTYAIGSLAGAGTLSGGLNDIAVGASGETMTFAGSATANRLVKQGAGMMTLSGSNTFQAVEVSAGTLVAAAAGALGNAPITISGGTFRNGVGGSLANPVTLSGAAAGIRFDFGVDALEYLVVGGGGSGSNGATNIYAGGGGGGQVLAGSLTPTGSSLTVFVGEGGASLADGTASQFDLVTANGGGRGGVTSNNARNGGVSGSGFAGGVSSSAEGAGGGGAGGPGTNAISSPRTAGDGGIGVASEITGVEVYYGGGGAGGGVAGGTGGLGGGGDRGAAGTANTGGGGAGYSAGGSGIVIVRYAGAPAAVGGTIDTASVPGYTLHTFSDVGSASLELSPAATMASPITGAGGFTLDSVGTLTLAANNSYQGGTIVSAGTLVAGSATAFGSGGITLANGTTIDLGGYAIANTIANNGGTILNAGNYAGSQSVDGDATFDGDVGGTVAIAAGGVGLFRGQVGGRVEIASGGIAELDDSASVGSGADFVNNGVLRSNRATDLTIGRPITGSGSLQKQGAGRLVLSGVNTYSGGTTVDAGALVVDGSILGDVGLVAGSRLGGSGTIGGTVSGGGVFGPGNSPGITTVGSIDPSGGLSFELEITGSLADWDAPTASVNDVIRLTDATPFTASMSAGNSISVLLDVAGADPAAPGTYTGGFFTDTAADFTSALANATFTYWVAGEFGTLGDRQQFATGSGGAPEWYTRLAAYDPALSVQWSTVPTTADFGSGAVSGYSTEFVVVPEPGTLALAGLAAAAAAAGLRRRPAA